MWYVATFILSVLCSTLISLLIVRYSNRPLKKAKKEKSPNKEKKVDKLAHVKLVFAEIKKNDKLPIPISHTMLGALKLIAETKDWEKQISENDIQEIEKIYCRWQKSLTEDKQQKLTKVESSHGFNQKYWEGTEEEYQVALANNEIDENTIVRIYENSEDNHWWIGHDEGNNTIEWFD